jgi:HEAT repeat protein
MRILIWVAMVSIAALALAQQAVAQDMDEVLARVARYEEGQGRQALIDLERLVRARPAAEVESRLAAFLGSKATAAGKHAVCRHLSVIGTDRSVAALRPLLLSEDTAEMARYALERIPGSASLEALREALTKAPVRARVGVINSLGVRRDPQAAPMLVKLASGADAAQAEAAIAALGRIASKEAVAALRPLRAKGSRTAMEALLVAAETVKSVEIYQDLAVPAAPAAIRVAALQGLAAVEPSQAVARWKAALQDPDAEVQAAAVRGLGANPSEAAANALIEAMPRLNAQARVRAIAALSMRSNPPAATIAKAMEDPDAAVRASAMEALSRVSEPAAIQRLAMLAASGNESERAAARLALERMPGAAADRAMVAAIGNAEAAVKLELIRAAGLRGISEAGDELVRAAGSSDRALRREALRALRESASAAQVAGLLALLPATKQEADRRELERAIAAALRRSPPSAGEAVLSAYRSAKEPAARGSLLQVLGQSGSREALPVVMEALEDPSPEIVRAAILAVTEWPEESPVRDLLGFAGRTQNAAHQTLALRGVLKLLDLPSVRKAEETVALLEQVMKLAQQPEEKQAVLSLLPRVPAARGLKLAEAALADQTVAEEAKIAVERLKRALSQ